MVVFFGWIALEAWKKDQKRGAVVGSTIDERWAPPEFDKLDHTAAAPVYERPATAPNGSPWPVYASYIPGSNVWATGGLSSVTVDNTGCDSDVHVKLKIWRDRQAHDVRECFIPAHTSFTFEKVAPGWFDVRYRDLGDGQLAKTEFFQLSETQMATGTNYSVIKLTNGNMKTTAISETEF